MADAASQWSRQFTLTGLKMILNNYYKLMRVLQLIDSLNAGGAEKLAVVLLTNCQRI